MFTVGREYEIPYQLPPLKMPINIGNVENDVDRIKGENSCNHRCK